VVNLVIHNALCAVLWKHNDVHAG